jgi:hypothetical protein
MVGTIIGETKGKAKERLKDAQPIETQKKNRVSPFLWSETISPTALHSPSNVACHANREI